MASCSLSISTFRSSMLAVAAASCFSSVFFCAISASASAIWALRGSKTKKYAASGIAIRTSANSNSRAPNFITRPP